MTETNAIPVDTEEKKAMTVSWRKLTDGIGLVFAGVLTMLEAMDAKTARDILDGYSQDISGQAEQEEKENGEKTGTGTVDDHDSADDAAVADPADAVEEPAQKEETAAPSKAKAKKQEPAVPSVTQDDITKIIVQKLKKDRSNNERIGAILKTYGVAKVSELPAEKYEAFLTDLSQL